MTFAKQLAYGQIGEGLIARWYKRQGYTILPIYEIEINTGKGPRLFAPERQLIAPDIFIFKSSQCYWIEAKHKTAFSWHRITNQWVTGIDLVHYVDYCTVDDVTPWPVWLTFLHEGGQAKDSPEVSPSGLFGGSLEYLRRHENHRHPNWGKGGMVYWSIGSLRKLATIEQVKG
jgi:hypothetical protein